MTKTKILVAVPNLGNVRAELSMMFLRWATNPKYQVKIWTPQHFVPLDYARNVIRKTFLAEGHDFLLSIDADVVPSEATIELADLDLDVVAPVCYVLKDEGIIPMALKRVEDGWQVVGDLERNQLVNVDCAGTGCLMIARRILEKVPLFRFGYDKDGMLLTDEGFAWSDAVREANFDIFVFTNLVCQHFKTVDLAQMVKLQNMARRVRDA